MFSRAVSVRSRAFFTCSGSRPPLTLRKFAATRVEVLEEDEKEEEEQEGDKPAEEAREHRRVRARASASSSASSAALRAPRSGAS